MKNEAALKRLRTVEGHMRGIIRMVEEDAYCIDKQLVQDFICPFCLCFPNDPVMCSECEHVSCLGCQKTYFSNPANLACSICRQESKDKFKPLNKKMRKKMSRLKFECISCKAILSVN